MVKCDTIGALSRIIETVIIEEVNNLTRMAFVIFHQAVFTAFFVCAICFPKSGNRRNRCGRVRWRIGNETRRRKGVERAAEGVKTAVNADDKMQAKCPCTSCGLQCGGVSYDDCRIGTFCPY